MIDIQLIREKPEWLLQNLAKRADGLDFAQVTEWDRESRKLRAEVEGLKAQRNKASAEIAAVKRAGGDAQPLIDAMQNARARVGELDAEIARLDDAVREYLVRLPNIPDPDVSAGGKEANQVVAHHGEKPSFDFPVKDHVELCESLGLIDYERGAKLAGAGSWVYRGPGARLEWALLNFFIDEHIADGYEFLLLPHMLNDACGFVAGQFPKFEDDVYRLEGEGDKRRFLLPTAETALVNLHRDEILAEKDLPKKYAAYTPCYRKEAGSYRSEERGMIRGHQFDKVEMVQYTTPEGSGAAFDELVGKAERLVQKLGLHYRLSRLAAGDCSFSMAKTFDIEVWIPSMGIYKEVSSASNARDYQARRGNIRYKSADGKNRFVHTLNASGLATSRILPALVEQFQQADGSVKLPEVLATRLGFDRLEARQKQ